MIGYDRCNGARYRIAGQWFARAVPSPVRLFGGVLAMAFALVALLAINIPARAADPAVTDIRIGAHADYTRFVVELNQEVPYRLMSLADPYRVVIDLPEALWAFDASQGRGERVGLVGKYRSGLFKPGVSRIVIDLAEPAGIRKHFRLEASADGTAGHRIVIDLERADDGAFRASVGEIASPDWAAYESAQPSRRSAEIRAPSPSGQSGADGKRVIVLDPGHGGVDPGAIGASGVYEKKIVLAFAQGLRTALENTGRYRVVLTRDRDLYIPLRNRYEIAQRNNADLFVSIHADAHDSNDLRGLSVYTLSEKASDREAAALAAKENKSDIIAGYDLTGYDEQTTFILLDLAQRKTSEASWQFARTLVDHVGQKVPLLRKPHRFAGFAVLKSPTVPSVLVELGYLSNRTEEKLLRSDSHRAKIASGMVQAIDAFFENQDRLNRS